MRYVDKISKARTCISFFRRFSFLYEYWLFYRFRKERYKNKGIGDQYEGAHFRILDNKKDVLSIEIDGKYHEIPYNRGFATRNNTSVHQLLLSCFTFIKFNSENYYLDGCKDEEYVYKLKPTVIEGLEKEFEGRIPVLINIELFFKRFESLVEKIILEEDWFNILMNTRIIHYRRTN